MCALACLMSVFPLERFIQETREKKRKDWEELCRPCTYRNAQDIVMFKKYLLIEWVVDG